MATSCVNSGSEEPQINYPTNWKYKCILEKNSSIKDISEEVLSSLDYKISKSAKSKTGKYESYNIELLVHSKEEQREIFSKLKSHQKVKFVL